MVDSTKEYEFEIVPLYQIYYNEESLFGIYTFCTAEDLPECKPYNNNDFDDLSDKKMNKCGKLVGNMQELYLGTKYKVKANMTYSKKYNEYQYKPLSIVAEVPKTFEAQKIFLKTQTNAAIADQLIAKYPNVVEDVMNGQLEMIDHSEIKGLGDKTWKKLRDKIIKNYVISDIVVMLQPYGVTLPTIERLLKSEPNPSVLKKQIEQNPYILTRVKGMGFKRVDDIALKLKPELRCSNQRLNAFISYDLHQVGDNDGHTYVYIKNLRSDISNAASECLPIFDEWLDEESDKKIPNYLYTSGDKIGLKSYYTIEMDIYELIKDMEKYSFGNITDYKPITDSEISQTISEVEDEEGFMFSEEQITGVNKALNCQVVFISGEAGTGKTTILKPIIKCYQKRNNSIVACALSAKAAQRIKEATGLDSRTIHRLLVAESIDSFCYNQDNPLPADVVIMDESSMTNASLFYNFLLAIRPGTRLIFCGDYMQLPPIGFGNIFSDLLKKKGLNSVQLTKPMRQAEKSGILTDARKIRRGINPLDSPQLKIVHGELNDMFYLFRKNRESLFNMAVKQYIKSVKEEGIDNVVIISPRRSNCTNSTDELNKAVQKELFASSNKPFVEFKDHKYYLGDKVLQTSNDYERDVFNGDIGYITAIDKEKEICLVSMNANIEEKMIEYSFAQLGQLQLAYALTTHKLQGSAAQTVIGIIDNTHYKLLDNCMLYTMLTRAKKRFALLAEPEAFKRCIVTNHNKRRTWLSLKN